MGRKHKAIVTHLEMLSEPRLPPAPRPLGNYALMQAINPPVHFYRYLYDVIGREYIWVNRKKLSDQALASIIQHDDVRIFVLYSNGAPAGFFELDFRSHPHAEFSFLGLMPEHIGKGLGRFLLREGIFYAWEQGISRLIIQTCTLDHQNALPLYQRNVFSPYGQEEVILEEPDN